MFPLGGLFGGSDPVATRSFLPRPGYGGVLALEVAVVAAVAEAAVAAAAAAAAEAVYLLSGLLMWTLCCKAQK
jgi:hypothetical protein